MITQKALVKFCESHNKKDDKHEKEMVIIEGKLTAEEDKVEEGNVVIMHYILVELYSDEILKELAPSRYSKFNTNKQPTQKIGRYWDKD